jgi:hypothetical protein
MKLMKIKNQRAFTIIELMIATSVLATMLILVATILVNIGNLYYKGINQARIQNDVRTIADDVAQNLMLDSAQVYHTADTTTHPGVTMEAYCIGSARYSYVVGTQISHQTNGSPSVLVRHVLWRDNGANANNCQPLDITMSNPPGSVKGTELIAPNSRLLEFTVTKPSPYGISVSAAYGDDDLLCDGNTAGDCAAANASTHVWTGTPVTPPTPDALGNILGISV